MPELKFKFVGGENQFKFQCDSCGTVAEEGKACPRCNHSIIRVYTKP